ncbi:MAG TPA: hydroxymethylbilane synthase [Myxococcales bacterium]|nr:hydroxymethylbilane synthase [Myxococcales bacterium]HIL01939.1 hydroxymethylbilane synthase [Myxococcales bacterium]
MMSTVRIATRGSDLALAQANYIAKRIKDELQLPTEIVIVSTAGDRIQNVSLAKIGGKGLFIKEIEEALLDGRADVAIHSAKDLPAEIAPGLELAAFPERADPRDALVAKAPNQGLEDLPQYARVGTGSTRRAALLRAHRPDLEIVPLRGNVPTRLGRLESDGLAAVVLACAGLDRLGRSSVISERISPDILLPAVCQGMLALEGRVGESITRDVGRLSAAENVTSATAEREFLTRLGGDCTVPLAAHCQALESGRIRIRGLVSSLDGRSIARAEVQGEAVDAESLGRDLAEKVQAAGGSEILEELRRESASEGASEL